MKLIRLLAFVIGASAGAQETHMALTLSSPDFQHSGEIPSSHTCEGRDQSPALQWSGAPAGTRTLALIVDDPDAPDPKAPRMTYVHWVVFNIPPTATGIGSSPRGKELPKGAQAGINDWRKAGYGGPCPPIGRHRYFHKLYALDTALDLAAPTKADLEKAMEGHILARAELVGTYQKKK